MIEYTSGPWTVIATAKADTTIAKAESREVSNETPK